MRNPKVKPSTPGRRRMNHKNAVKHLGELVTEHFEGIGYYYVLIMDKSSWFNWYINGEFSRETAEYFVRHFLRSVSAELGERPKYIYSIEPRSKAGVIVHMVTVVHPRVMFQLMEKCGAGSAVADVSDVHRVRLHEGNRIARSMAAFVDGGLWHDEGLKGKRLYVASRGLSTSLHCPARAQ